LSFCILAGAAYSEEELQALRYNNSKKMLRWWMVRVDSYSFPGIQSVILLEQGRKLSIFAKVNYLEIGEKVLTELMWGGLDLVSDQSDMQENSALQVCAKFV